VLYFQRQIIVECFVKLAIHDTVNFALRNLQTVHGIQNWMTNGERIRYSDSPTTFPGICAAVQHWREAEITHCPRNSRNGLCDGRRISVSDVLTRSLLHRLAKLRVKFGQDLNFFNKIFTRGYVYREALGIGESLRSRRCCRSTTSGLKRD
jgi:hypothetical protein